MVSEYTAGYFSPLANNYANKIICLEIVSQCRTLSIYHFFCIISTTIGVHFMMEHGVIKVYKNGKRPSVERLNPTKWS